MGNPVLQSDRQIRVFISSTFRDMQEERDVLIKRVFPQLRKLCEERAVTWTEVDLRWGITTEQAAEGKVLPLCLEEIHRCRPYFIGLLGERYGWIPEPDSVPTNLLESQPWFKQHLRKSVTELEILHGVFSDEAMHKHAYFYFRDPKYAESVPDAKRQDFSVESAEAAEKLENLKQTIRSARDKQICELRENYANPEQLGEWILEDFTNLINRIYPTDRTPHPLDQEAALHEAYARSRRLAFVGREDLLRTLDEHCATSGKPLVLTGESGSGKSALLAEWVAHWRNGHPDDLVIQHYIGSTPDSADWEGLVRRILGELKRAFAITEDIPLQPDALRTALNHWTAKAGGSRRVVLVLDGLNQLAHSGTGAQVEWLPIVFPTNFRVLVSSLPGENLNVLRDRDWPELNVPLFTRGMIAPAAIAYFKIFSKTPSPDLVAKLESTPAACNALYLRAVLDELRQFGSHEELTSKAAEYLSAPKLPELFDRILTRWQDDFGKDPEHADIVHRSLCLITCARFGLSEAELLDLLGEGGRPLLRRAWTPFYLAAENALTLRAGLLNLGHEHLRAAVRKRWLRDAATVRDFNLQLASYFERQPTGIRKATELPWQLRQAGERDRLRQQLLTLPIFLLMQQRDELELRSYWIWLGEDSAMGKAYRRVFEEWATNVTPTEIANMAHHLGDFLLHTSQHDVIEPLLRRALAIDEQQFGAQHPNVASDLRRLGVLLRVNNRMQEAEVLLRRAVAIFEQAGSKSCPAYADALGDLAEFLWCQSKWSESETLLWKALEVDEHLFGKEHSRVAHRLGFLSTLRRAAGDLVKAESLLTRARSISAKNLGAEHPSTASGDLGLAMIAAERSGDLVNLETTIREGIGLLERVWGKNNPEFATALAWHAQLLQATNRLTEAEPIMRQVISIHESVHGPEHPDVAQALNNLAQLFQAEERFMEAEPLLRRALQILERSWGTNHPDVARVLNNLAHVLAATDRVREAEPVMRRHIEIFLEFARINGIEHPQLQAGIMNYGGLLQLTGMAHSDILDVLRPLAPQYVPEKPWWQFW